MKFNQLGALFQCQCDDREFDEYLVAMLLRWCRQTSISCRPNVASVSEYEAADADEGLDAIHTRWSVRFAFDRDDEAMAFKLFLDECEAVEC